MIRVVVVDDHELVRKGICALLGVCEDVEVVGEAADGVEAIEIVTELKPDVVVMDVSMPRLDGIQAIERLNLNHTAAVMLSMHEDEMLVRRVFQVGGSGFVLKRAVSEDLVNSVRAAAKRERFVSEGIANIDIDDFLQKDVRTVFDLLTVREREVLQLIVEGFTNKKIAETLVISTKTVEKHRANCMDKLNVSDIASLVRLAIQHRLVIVETSSS